MKIFAELKLTSNKEKLCSSYSSNVVRWNCQVMAKTEGLVEVHLDQEQVHCVTWLTPPICGSICFCNEMLNVSRSGIDVRGIYLVGYVGNEQRYPLSPNLYSFCRSNVRLSNQYFERVMRFHWIILPIFNWSIGSNKLKRYLPVCLHPN